MQELLHKALWEIPVVVLDTETTGLDPITGDRVVEIGAMRFEPRYAGQWQLQEKFDYLIQPGRRMDPKASRINGIYDRDLLGKPTFSHLAEELFSLLSGTLIIAHNASFDAGFLGLEFYIDSLQRTATTQFVLDNPWLCTMQLARRQFRFGRNSLGQVARSLGVRQARAHRALNDVQTTADVAIQIAQRLARRQINSVRALLQAQGGPIYAPVFKIVALPSPLSEALANKSPLRIVYDDYSGTRHHICDPLYSTTSFGRKYLIGHSREMQDQCTFQVDRILSAELFQDGGGSGA